MEKANAMCSNVAERLTLHLSGDLKGLFGKTTNKPC